MSRISPQLLSLLGEHVGATPRDTGDDLAVRVPGGAEIRFQVKHRSRASVEDVRRMAEHPRHGPGSGAGLLIVTARLAPAARSLLTERGISGIEEETGYCHIQGPGLLIDRLAASWAAPRRRGEEGGPARPATELQGKSGVYAETLLVHYLHGPIHAAESAGRAGISSPLASRILNRLDARGITEPHGAGPRKRRTLVDPAGLLDLWTREEKRESWQRRGVYAWSRTPRELYGRLRALDRLDVRWALRGTAAANLYAPTLTTAPAPELWVASAASVAEIAHALDGEPVESGANLFVWQAAGDLPLHHARPEHAPPSGETFPVVSEYRAYVETAEAGARSSDVAERLREQMALPHTA